MQKRKPGRKSIPDEQKKKANNVYLTAAEKIQILAKHSSLTQAILTTIKPVTHDTH